MIAETAAEVASAEPTNPRSRSVFGASFTADEIGVVDLAVLLAATLWCLGFVPVLVNSSWSARFIVLLAVAPLGLVTLARFLRARDRASTVGVAFVASACVSASLSPEPWLSFVGRWSGDKSVLVYGSAIAVWALGRRLSEHSVRILPVLVIVALVPSIVIGVLQITLDVSGGPLGTLDGRASGLFGNPVFLGSALAGACAYAAVRTLSASGLTWPSLFATFTFGVGITGSRVAPVAVILAVATYVAVSRPGFVRIVTMCAAAAAGGIGSLALGHWAGGASSGSRLSGGGLTDRVQVWRYGVDAASDRPLFGWGLGNYAVAIQDRYSNEFARDFASHDVLGWWSDPHNVPIMLLVSTGIIGFALATAFLASSLRIADNAPLIVMFAATAVTWLLQPASMHSLPLTMLILGAACQRVPALFSADGRRVSIHDLVALAIGVLLAGYVATVDFNLSQSSDRSDAEGIEAAAERIWPDPFVADMVARVYADRARVDPSFEDEALRWARQAAETETHRPLWWNRLAQQQLLFGRTEEARTSLERSLELQPTNATATQLMIYYSILVDDRDLEVAWRSRLCELEPDRCDATDGDLP
jgi:O-antigen ligase